MTAKTGYDKFIENALKYGWMIPAGLIAIWKGSIATIPTGWALCDGNNGTPDLRDKFIVGAGDSFAPDTAGGSLTHTHDLSGATSEGQASLQDSGHDHSSKLGDSIISEAYTGNIGEGGDTNYSNITDSGHSHGISTSGGATVGGELPPYYALAFIMKT